MVTKLRPSRGGFQRPFGAATFIIDFLAGRGDNYGVLRIDPARGAPQTDILAAYKEALHQAWAQDRVAREKEERIRRGLPPFTDAEEAARLSYWLACYPLARCRMRYHSFLIYFRVLKELGWVEPTGETEPSEVQENYPDGPPRIFFRLTRAGLQASPAEVSNPLPVLYPQFDPAYFARMRGRRKYVKCR